MLVALPGMAAAQDLDDLVRTDPFSDDPIGVDAQSDLHRIPVPRAGADAPLDLTHGPVPPSVEPAEGAVLTAIPGVRETDHAVRVELADGLARVRTELRFVNGARYPAEVWYRLAVPEGAALSSLRVCTTADRCRDAVPDASGGVLSAYDDAVRARGSASADAALPIAQAEMVRDERGVAIAVRAAPVAKEGGELRVELGYVAPAAVRGGVARLLLPARGQDPRAAAARVSVTSTDLLSPGIAGGGDVEPWVDATITAHAATDAPIAASALRFACDAGGRAARGPAGRSASAAARRATSRGAAAAGCTRLRVVAGPRRADPVDLIVLVDASPSMEGPARGRVGAAIATLLASAPRGSRVRAVAFGARAEAVIEEPVAIEDAPLVPFARAAMRDLGASTQLGPALAMARTFFERDRDPGLDPLVVIVGDGRATGLDAAGAARPRGVSRGVSLSQPLVVIDVADREVMPELAELARASGGVAIEAGAEADLAARGRDGTPLEEALAKAFAKVVARSVTARAGGRAVSLGALRAGEEIVYVATGRGASITAAGRTARARSAEPELARALAGTRGESPRLLAVAGEDLAGDPAPARCDARGPGTRPSGVSSDLSPIALAGARSCAVPAPAAAGADEGRGVPATTVLNMLRQRVVPVARRCFRRDRAGRAEYSVRATFEFRLGDREVLDATVRGSIDERLRQCLLEAVHELDVPRFEGVVVVRYPLFTEPELRPPMIELEPEVAQQVDRILR